MLYEVITMHIKTTARMWNWSFTYENGKVTDTLYIPVGLPVALDMEALDVIHSLYIPRITSYNVCYTKLLRVGLASHANRYRIGKAIGRIQRWGVQVKLFWDGSR